MENLVLSCISKPRNTLIWSDTLSCFHLLLNLILLTFCQYKVVNLVLISCIGECHLVLEKVIK